MWFEERLVSSVAHHARHASASKSILKPMSFLGFDPVVQKEVYDWAWQAAEQLVREKYRELERQAQAFVDAGFPLIRLTRLSTVGKSDDQVALKRTDEDAPLGTQASDWLWLDANNNALTPDKLPPEAFEDICDKPVFV